MARGVVGLDRRWRGRARSRRGPATAPRRPATASAVATRVRERVGQRAVDHVHAVEPRASRPGAAGEVGGGPRPRPRDADAGDAADRARRRSARAPPGIAAEPRLWNPTWQASPRLGGGPRHPLEVGERGRGRLLQQHVRARPPAPATARSAWVVDRAWPGSRSRRRSARSARPGRRRAPARRARPGLGRDRPHVADAGQLDRRGPAAGSRFQVRASRSRALRPVHATAHRSPPAEAEAPVLAGAQLRAVLTSTGYGSASRPSAANEASSTSSAMHGSGSASASCPDSVGQQVRVDRHVERPGQLGDAQERGDPAHPHHVRLHDVAGPRGQQVAEAVDGVDVLADRDRHVDGPPQLHVRGHVVGGQRLLQPVQAVRRAARRRRGGPGAGPSAGWRRSSAACPGRSPRGPRPPARRPRAGRAGPP